MAQVKGAAIGIQKSIADNVRIKPLDDVELKIVQLLQDDSRISNKHIAKTINVSETTVANRLRSMSNRNAMRIVAQRDIYHGEYSEMALLYLSVSADKIVPVARKLAQLDEALSVSLTATSPELILNLRVRNRTHLDQLLNEIVYRLDGLRSVIVDIILQGAKYDSGVGDLSIELPQTAFPNGATEIDDRIIACLLTDGRMSNREIARRLGVSENNVRLRLQKMLETNQMRLGVVCNPLAAGVTTNDWIRIKAAPSATATVIETLVNNEDCDFVASTSGEYGAVAVVHARDPLDLGRHHCREVANLDGVLEIKSYTLIQHFKHRYDLTRIDKAA